MDRRLDRRCRLWWELIAGVVFGDARKFNRGPAGEPCDEQECSAHGLDRPAQRREQQVAALLQQRNRILAVAELLRNVDP